MTEHHHEPVHPESHPSPPEFPAAPEYAAPPPFDPSAITGAPQGQSYPVQGAWPGYPPQYGAQPYGAQPYGPPGYGQLPAVPPGYPPPYPYPYGYPVPTTTNGFAIASLVLGLVWIEWVGSILALIFGFIALNQIKKRQQNGRGLAIAGVVLGVVGLATLLAVIILAST